METRLRSSQRLFRRFRAIFNEKPSCSYHLVESYKRAREICSGRLRLGPHLDIGSPSPMSRCGPYRTVPLEYLLLQKEPERLTKPAAEGTIKPAGCRAG